MNDQLSQNEQKLIALLKYAPVGLLEIDADGNIASMNIKAEEMLMPIIDTHNTGRENAFPILQHIQPGIIDSIKAFTGDGGVITQDIHIVHVPVDGRLVEKHFLILANKQVDQSIMLSFDDFTERITREKAMHQVEVDKAVEQGKFEIASDVLHDIGNAVVGFGSYLTRIKRLLEQNNLDNLHNLAGFCETQQAAFAAAIGEDKAKAMVDMLGGISKTQKESYEEIGRSITEQLNIITHIQEILNIQRQYVTGRESQERKPVNLRSIINDCMAMLFASFDKRGIEVSLNVTAESPIIKGDRTKLMQVILNIFKNSLEAININVAQKSIVINLSASATALILEVKDSGNGFDKTIADRLFERNFTTKSTGTGLGLHNCKAIIESHSGSINITSEGPNKGAVTTIEFNLN